MTRLNKFCLLLLASALQFGCGPAENLFMRDYIRYLNSEQCPLYSSKTQDKIKFECRLQTEDLITLLSAGPNFETTKAFEAEKAEHAGQLNVVFIISDEIAKEHQVKERIFDKKLYSSMLSYANTELQYDFNLQLENGDVVPCNLVHLEAANSVKPVIRITAAFNCSGAKLEGCSLMFDDKLFNTGRMKFYYAADVFKDLPKLKI